MKLKEKDLLKFIKETNLAELYEVSFEGNNLFSHALYTENKYILKALILKRWKIKTHPNGGTETENFLSITHHLGDFGQYIKDINMLIIDFMEYNYLPTYYLDSIMGLNLFCQEIFFHDSELYKKWISSNLNHSDEFILSLGELMIVQPRVLIEHLDQKNTDFIQKIYDNNKTNPFYKPHIHNLLTKRNKIKFIENIKS